MMAEVESGLADEVRSDAIPDAAGSEAGHRDISNRSR
jgi:hypothetical protein